MRRIGIGRWRAGKGSGTLRPALSDTTVAGKKSETASRLGDALTWFGQAAFESTPGIQIVNFVAALERLTTTESFGTHKFCSRVALLAYEKDSDFENTYWDAHTIHTARSSVIHGEFSPSSPEFRKSLRLAHDVTRNALFRGLEVHARLDSGGRMSNLSDLQNFFVSQHSKWAVVLKRMAGNSRRWKRS